MPLPLFIVMEYGKSQKASESKLQMQIAIARFHDGTYMTIDQVVKALGVPKSTLYRQWV
jgi:AcrR family transcriptional regulator